MHYNKVKRQVTGWKMLFMQITDQKLLKDCIKHSYKLIKKGQTTPPKRCKRNQKVIL